MRVDVLSIFPEMFSGPLTESLIGKAREKKIVDIRVHDIRSFTQDKHKITDDRPFGGGPGMVMKVDPVHRALKKLGACKKAGKSGVRPYVLYLSPQGEKLTQKVALDLSKKKRLILLCGHYEGVDERIMAWVDREISIGDYVLTGGELPAMVLIDCVARLLPGTVKDPESLVRDSFYSGLLDYPHYTRPAQYRGMDVPAVLRSGNHAQVDLWRRKQSLLNTLVKRPDLLEGVSLDLNDKKLLEEIKKEIRKK